jgi:uncharacterized protein YdeI (YjbR/CyaY-like superfamily)
MKSDIRIDGYIEQSAPFAQPILRHLRALVHQACPEVEETMKWRFPHFDYKGTMMCHMAAFKKHCAFGFWKADLMKDKSLLEVAKSEVAMGHLGRICTLNDLPPDKKLIAYIKEAMTLNEKGVRLNKGGRKSRKEEIAVPADFMELLSAHPDALLTFEQFTPSCKYEYIEWISESKTTPTRVKRMAQAIEWMSEGKKRNWKYM